MTKEKKKYTPCIDCRKRRAIKGGRCFNCNIDYLLEHDHVFQTDAVYGRRNRRKFKKTPVFKTWDTVMTKAYGMPKKEK